MKLNCVIIDDEPKAIEIIERYVAKIPFLTLMGSFRDPMDAIVYLNENRIDVLFLDINMPNLSGLKIPSLLDQNISIIFTTAYAEYAIDGFELNALDYLLKPITFERFLKAATKANDAHLIKEKLKNSDLAVIGDMEKEMLFLKSGTQIHKIDVDDILYFEKESVYFMVHLKNEKKIIIRTNFSGLMDILPERKFIRIHKSYLISLKHIDVITNEEVTIGKQKIPISDSFREEFMNVIKKKRILKDGL